MRVRPRQGACHAATAASLPSPAVLHLEPATRSLDHHRQMLAVRLPNGAAIRGSGSLYFNKQMSARRTRGSRLCRPETIWLRPAHSRFASKYGLNETMLTRLFRAKTSGNQCAYIRSALPLRAAITQTRRHSHFVPGADVCSAAKSAYSITSSARNRIVFGITKLSAFAAFKFTTNTSLVGNSTGNSLGFLPFKLFCPRMTLLGHNTMANRRHS
jgi:hypothetical protein